MTKERIMQLAKMGTFISYFDKNFKCYSHSSYVQKYLENLGFTVLENKMVEGYGYAKTDCGVYVSTNSYCWIEESDLYHRKIETIEDVIDMLEILRLFEFNKTKQVKYEEMIEVLKCE